MATFVLPPKKTGLLNQALEAIGLHTGQGADLGQSLIPAQVRRLLSKLPGVFLRARSGEPLARMPHEVLLP